MKKEILEKMENQILPGNTGSKHAGFKGSISHIKGKDYNRRDAVLIKCSGWHQYSRNYGRFIDRAGLVVKDETGVHMIRVSPQCTTVREAIAWIEPAEVKSARQEKRKVIRQGDFYFVRLKVGKNNFSALRFTRHEVHETITGIEIRHLEHHTITLLGKPWKAIRQKASNGRVD